MDVMIAVDWCLSEVITLVLQLFIYKVLTHISQKSFEFSFFTHTTHRQHNIHCSYHHKSMQGSRCLDLEVQIISARKDSVQTWGELQLSFKAEERETQLRPCNHQASTKCLHWEQTELDYVDVLLFLCCFFFHIWRNLLIYLLLKLQLLLFNQSRCFNSSSHAKDSTCVLTETKIIRAFFHTWQETNWHVA